MSFPHLFRCWPWVLFSWLTWWVLDPSSVQGATSREYVIDAWQTEDGLPQNTITAINQTRDGYLWLGTFNGLVRFDGVRFTIFTPVNTPALRSGNIRAIYEDRQGRLWICMVELGIVCYENGVFKAVPILEQGEPLEVASVLQSREGFMIVSTPKGLFQEVAGGWKRMEVPESDYTEATLDVNLAQNKAGIIWFSHRNKLYLLGKGGWELRQRFRADIRTLAVDELGTARCIVKWGEMGVVPLQGPVRMIPVPPMILHGLRRTRNGDYWLCGQNGLWRIRGEDWLHLTTQEGLINNDVTEFFEDREGNLWAGTDGGGLQRLRQKVVTVHSTEGGLTSNNAMSVLEDREGRVWVGTFRGGVDILENGRWKQFPTLIPDTMETNVVSLWQTRDGAIWLAGHRTPHHRWQNNRLEEVSDLTYEAIPVLFEDREGGFWMGTLSSGVEFRQGTQRRFYSRTNGLSHPHVTAITQDQAGDIWIGTTHGLNRLGKEGIRSYFRKDGLGADEVNALLADPNGSLWIGTAGGGLSRWKNGSFQSITMRQGLNSDVIGQLLEDDLGYLWLGSPAGLARARKADLVEALEGRSDFVPTSTFGKTEGIPQPECAGGVQPACMKTREGILWFCTIGGMVQIDPRRLERNLLPPPVHIESVVLDGHSTQPQAKAPGAPRRVMVPAGTSRVELHYAGLGLVTPRKVRFRYYLEGYDPAWQPAVSDRIANYTHVPPGDYRFHLMAANNDGIWNREGTSLDLRVAPFFWQTLWFRGVIVLVVAGLMGALYLMRLSYLRHVQQLRLGIADDLHDETGGNLGTILLLVRRASRRLGRQENPQGELEEIQRITAGTAESIRDVAWLINPDFETLQQMLKQMDSLAVRLLVEVKFDFKWNLTHLDRTLSLEFRRHFYMLFREILHNIQKHAQAREVEISLSEQATGFVLKVRDNGQGFDPDLVTRGQGLSSLRRRVAELEGELWLESRPGQGTTITVQASPTQTRGWFWRRLPDRINNLRKNTRPQAARPQSAPGSENR